MVFLFVSKNSLYLYLQTCEDARYQNLAILKTQRKDFKSLTDIIIG